jgi:hypothetical protein
MNEAVASVLCIGLASGASFVACGVAAITDDRRSAWVFGAIGTLALICLTGIAFSASHPSKADLQAQAWAQYLEASK